MSRTLVRLSHWLPIVTICPVNNLPDLVYITLEFENRFVELYAARKKLRKVARWRRMFMEDLASRIHYAFPEACAVEVKLAFGKHVVRSEERPIINSRIDIHAEKLSDEDVEAITKGLNNVPVN